MTSFTDEQIQFIKNLIDEHLQNKKNPITPKQIGIKHSIKQVRQLIVENGVGLAMEFGETEFTIQMLAHYLSKQTTLLPKDLEPLDQNSKIETHFHHTVGNALKFPVSDKPIVQRVPNKRGVYRLLPEVVKQTKEMYDFLSNYGSSAAAVDAVPDGERLHDLITSLPVSRDSVFRLVKVLGIETQKGPGPGGKGRVAWVSTGDAARLREAAAAVRRGAKIADIRANHQ